jgi:hypothetical protein
MPRGIERINGIATYMHGVSFPFPSIFLKPKLFNWRWKLENRECLKYFGRISAASCGGFIIKIRPEGRAGGGVSSP